MAANVYSLKPPAPATHTHLIQTRITQVHDGMLHTGLPDCPTAHRALSCLIEPLVGDLVLLALDEHSGTGHVLAILERPGPQAAALTLPGGGAIHSTEGQVRIQARSLHLDGQRDVSLNTGVLHIAAVHAATTIKHWQGWFDTLEARAVSIDYAAKTLSAKVGRLLSRALESFRTVDGLDETRTGRSRVRVRDDHRLEAGHITAQAQGFVKIDGQKIDLG